MRIAVVISSYNRCVLLKHALESLTHACLALKEKAVVVVFDAGSTDGSREYLDSMSTQSEAMYGPALHVLNPGDGRTSFSAGLNQGVAWVEKQYPEVEYLLFYETDNEFASAKAIESAVTLLDAKPDLGACGFTVELRDGRKMAYGCRAPTTLQLILGSHFCHFFRINRTPLSPWIEHNGLYWRRCEIVFTSPLLIRKRAWNSVAGMDENRFPFSDSDLDLCLRLRQKGWILGVLDLPGIVHDNKGQVSLWSAHRVVERELARFRLTHKHLGPPGFLCLWLMLVRQCLELLLTIVFVAMIQKPVRVIESRLRLVWATIRVVASSLHL